jgi:hypothetical protein
MAFNLNLNSSRSTSAPPPMRKLDFMDFMASKENIGLHITF